MTNLSDFLKVEKVRCVKERGEFITIGEEYDVLDRRVEVKIIYDEGYSFWFDSDQFEPVLEPAENPEQGVELTPEFEALTPNVSEFKAGDPVYWGLKSRIFKIHRFLNTNVLEVELDGIIIAVHKDELCPATQENYEKLCKLYPHIEFEAPPKPLTGSDLARALIKKGWVGFNCLCGNSGDENANTETIVTGTNNSGQFTTIGGKLFNNAIPVIGWRRLEAREVGL